MPNFFNLHFLSSSKTIIYQIQALRNQKESNLPLLSKIPKFFIIS